MVTSLSSPTIAPVSVRRIEIGAAETGEKFFVSEHDVGRIMKFGVGPRGGFALVRFERLPEPVWLSVVNLEITPTPHLAE